MARRRFPAGALSVPDAEQLPRILKRGQPVRMKLVLQSRNLGTRQSGNVIAEVPGRDPSLPPILVSGHLDSWDQGTGAVDDASGVAIAAAAAKRIMDAGRPLRTIRVVWFGAEEVGLFGGLDYRARHGKEPHYALIESDFGADRIWKVDSKLGDARKAEAEAIGKALAPLGIVTGSFTEADGLRHWADAGRRPARRRSEPGRHALLRPPPHPGRHARQDRPGPAPPECRRLDRGAGGLSGGIEEPKARKRR